MASSRDRRSGAAALAATAIVAAAIVLAPAAAAARELGLAEGAIAIHAPAEGLRSPGCGELTVEARDALDNHLIGRTQPTLAEDGSCRYAISVPAQSAVWLRVRAALVADARAPMAGVGTGLGATPASASGEHHVSSRAVQLRFTVIAPTTSFFDPGEKKTIPLSY